MPLVGLARSVKIILLGAMSRIASSDRGGSGVGEHAENGKDMIVMTTLKHFSDA